VWDQLGGAFAGWYNAIFAVSPGDVLTVTTMSFPGYKSLLKINGVDQNTIGIKGHIYAPTISLGQASPGDPGALPVWFNNINYTRPSASNFSQTSGFVFLTPVV